MILHSPKNFGGTRTRPKNKVVCMLGVGSQATCVLLDLKTAFKDIKLIVLTVHDLAKCKSAKEVTNIPAPGEDGLVGFEGSAIFIPGPILSNTIIKLNSKKPFELIPIISNTARIFDNEYGSGIKAVHHADNLSAWLYGVLIGLVPETRYSVNPDNIEISNFCKDQHLQCITSAMALTSTTAGGAVVVDNASVISQITNAISLQNKEAIESNNLRCKEIERQIEHKEKKKDRIKKLHPVVLNMLKRASATNHNNENNEIAPTFLQFINSDNIGLAQYKLIHQFKEGGFPDITFALGILIHFI